MRLTVALSFVLPAQVLDNENTETPDYTIVGGSTINAIKEARIDAARRSFGLVAGRTNLKDFTHTLAETLTWRDHRGADGVQMRSIKGGDRRIQARTGVILSAGSLKSPVILENSGVGNPKILSKHGIDVKAILPAVGENLQDQPNLRMTVEAKTNWTGYPPFVTHSTAPDLFGSNTSGIALHINGKIPAYASVIQQCVYVEMVEKQLQIQADLIFKQNTPCLDATMFPSDTSVLSASWGWLPFSRGSVHLSSTDPNVGSAGQF